MRAIPCRALGRATVAATACAVVLVGASSAAAQRPEKLGNGVKTGQLSVQMFNYGGYISGGGNTGAANPVTGVSEACLTATTTPCRYERLERLFAFLQSKGVTSIELFGHAGFPSNTDIDGEFGLRNYRALMDEYGLMAAGWHGSMSETAWDARVNAAKILGADYIGSGGVGDPGIGSYANTLLTAQSLNRLGKRSVEAGVGPVYIHNHTGEFDAKYVHNGVEKTAFDILMEETDERYVAAELDVFWSSDAFDDVTGTASAALISKWPTRIQMLHVKDGIGIVGGTPTNSRSGSPRATGTGELDFRPIFAAAVDKVSYYHQEHDGGTTTDANTSLTNLRGSGPAAVGTLLARPASFPAVPAGTPAAMNVVPVLVQNTGDAPLTVSNVTVQANALDAPSASDFAIVSHNCGTTAAPVSLPPGVAGDATTPSIPRGTCTVNVGFKPTRTNATSVARLQFTSSSDNATDSVLLVGRSTGDSYGSVGGEVPGTLQLTVPSSAASFGTFVPGLARDYNVSMAASVTHTAGDAALSVVDASTAAPGHLVNGAFSLPQPLQIRASTVANPSPAFAPLAGSPLTLASWTGPASSAPVTLGFRQSIGASDPLRTGTYSKSLTFTLSTTSP